MNQQSQPVSPYPVDRGDELDLMGLWKVLVEYKLLIIVFTTLTTLGAAYYASTLPTIYKAEVLMIPASGGGSSTELSGKLGGLASMAGISLGGGGNVGPQGEEALARLKTRSFLINHIKERNLKSVFFSDQWDESEQKWIDKEPSDREASKFLLDMIATSANSQNKVGLITLSLEWKNPGSPNKMADIANGLVSSMNFHAKQRAILEAKKSISFLEKELERTSIINAQTILYSLIEQQTGEIVIANVRAEFVFKIIDPAVIPNDKEPDNKYLIIFFGLFFGLFSALLLVILIMNLKKIKESD